MLGIPNGDKPARCPLTNRGEALGHEEDGVDWVVYNKAGEM